MPDPVMPCKSVVVLFLITSSALDWSLESLFRGLSLGFFAVFSLSCDFDFIPDGSRHDQAARLEQL